MKYKVGDKVKVREDLIKINEKENVRWYIVQEMIEYEGKQATITRVTTTFYDLDIDNSEFNWSDAMLEPVEEDFNKNLKIPVSFMEVLETDKRVIINNSIIYKVYRKHKENEDDIYKSKIVKDILDGKFHYLHDIIYAISGYMGCSDWKELIKDGKFYLEEDN
jgi:hypothetical protein